MSLTIPILSSEKFPVKEEAMQVQPSQKEALEKQGYRLVGHHSAVKVCHWTKKMMKQEGGCYKFVFYGIRSHQCLQMTTSMFCASRCTFCWRGEKAPVSKDWYGAVDEPEHIIEHAIDAHLRLLLGFHGNEKSNKRFLEESNNVRHVALSLTGEPITYPKINEILKAFHKRKISTFLVTNAQYPEQIEKIDKVTQLYLSVDAPTKELLKQIDRPLFPDYYERLLKCLDLLKTRTYRTCIRLTMMRGHNMDHLQGYADLISRGEPDFIEVKGYVYVGASQEHHEVKDMPTMQEIDAFAQELLGVLPDYEYVRNHEASKVCLLMRKDLNKKCWINYPTFFEMIEKGKDFTAKDYSEKTIQPNC